MIAKSEKKEVTNMQCIIAVLCIAVFLIIIDIFSDIAKSNNWSRKNIEVEVEYFDLCYISRKKENMNMVEIRTEKGGVFTYILPNTNELYVGQDVTVVFNDNGTKDIYDDEIVDIMY